MITILDGTQGQQQKLQEILERNHTEKNDVQTIVDDILQDIKKNGTEALFRYTKQFDHVTLTEETIQVTKEELQAA